MEVSIKLLKGIDYVVCCKDGKYFFKPNGSEQGYSMPYDTEQQAEEEAYKWVKQSDEAW